MKIKEFYSSGIKENGKIAIRSKIERNMAYEIREIFILTH